MARRRSYSSRGRSRSRSRSFSRTRSRRSTRRFGRRAVGRAQTVRLVIEQPVGNAVSRPGIPGMPGMAQDLAGPRKAQF